MTDTQCETLEPLLVILAKRGPKHGADLRHVVDAMLYISHPGCRWRFLPEEFGIAAESGAIVVAACLRNAPVAAEYLAATSLLVSVIACGERWSDGTLRPSLEDLLGAGAALANVGGDLSPEARSAVAAWQDAKDTVADALLRCASGRELVERGFLHDVEYASAYGVSDVVPVLVNGAFRHVKKIPPTLNGSIIGNLRSPQR